MTLIREVKFSDLNNQKKTQSVKDMQKAAHSQGYDMSDPKKLAEIDEIYITNKSFNLDLLIIIGTFFDSPRQILRKKFKI